NQRAEANSARVLGNMHERNESFERIAVLWSHEREEVIGPPERLEAQVLSHPHDAAPEVPVQPLLSLDHDAKLHGHSLVVGGQWSVARENQSPATAPCE